MERPAKRARLNDDVDGSHAGRSSRSPFSLTHRISPPPATRTRLSATPAEEDIETSSEAEEDAETDSGSEAATPRATSERVSEPTQAVPSTSPTTSLPSGRRIFKSPFQLTKIRDLPAASNQDAVTLKDLLGDPLISDCWNFNYLHSIPFLMSAFDPDVRDLVKVHVVHGFWKKDDGNRLKLEEDAKGFQNVSVHEAYLPEMFGTHHSKMLLLLRHDDTAQVIIHTANMIHRDWTNMTQAVWRSPLLPLLRGNKSDEGDARATTGSGTKFKADLLSYLSVYESRRRRICQPIIDSLSKYDFSAVKGALIASVPGRHNIWDDSPTRWGWKAVREALRAVPVQDGPSEIVVQISSIATLGPSPTWLRDTFFSALSSRKGPAGNSPKPSFKVVFPTADEIRRSLDGYAAGGSIHTKIQSPQQTKQLQYLRPIFCHWANDAPHGAALPKDGVIEDAGRQRAAPHIKTYIRYGQKSIDWALVTSANLSKQAWGEAANSSGEMRVSSYEIGVLVWPALYDEKAVMVPTFRTDEPVVDEAKVEAGQSIVGVRIPYNLPLQPYGKAETPWVATQSYSEPDWMGQVWEGY
ncbi:Tyrosyl-DNA phosphodiesterase [Coniochaeta hoffmannii]|uniref:Tyrosyl-DNA phosphodiesterase n=1 Tax=Coniochaeta hoffmannii TaxID=91930 RepID=A0AA38RB56_9PEZI|nr:Tyrosyl-DNA phosphodiesterase [Coniochaeta hoffmannii]